MAVLTPLEVLTENSKKLAAEINTQLLAYWGSNPITVITNVYPEDVIDFTKRMISGWDVTIQYLPLNPKNVKSTDRYVAPRIKWLFSAQSRVGRSQSEYNIIT